MFLQANYTAQPQPLDLGIIHAFKCHYREQMKQKTGAMIDGRLLQDAAQMKLYVLSAKHVITESWRLITPTAIKNCSVKCGCLINHVSSNGNSAVKLSEDEEDGWHSLQPLRVHSEDCPTCD
jgi:hypothetical protein